MQEPGPTLPGSPPTAGERFRATSRFAQLDGLRGVAILLVIADHTADPLWTPLRGYLGVTAFFVISGFIITTLLLREETATGRPSIRNFYLRRIFRILPLYYLALAVFAVLVIGLRLGDDVAAFEHRLPYYLLYGNELAGSGTFSHSWSLGVEEKFYLLWPVLAFGLPFTRRHRGLLTCAIIALATASDAWPRTAYMAIYLPIMVGCLLAVVMHTPRGFEAVRLLTRPVPAVALIAAALVVGGRDRSTTYVHVEFAYTFGAAFVVLLLQPVAVRVLSLRPLVFIGRRSYAVYLFHPLVGNIIARGIAAGSTSVPRELLRYVLVTGISLVVADVLFRTFEEPLIRLGRRFTRSALPPDSVPPAPPHAGHRAPISALSPRSPRRSRVRGQPAAARPARERAARGRQPAAPLDSPGDPR